MGTSRIEEALEMLETRGKAETNGLVAEAVDSARAELEAIRKVAKTISTAKVCVGLQRADVREAMDTVDAIASEGT